MSTEEIVQRTRLLDSEIKVGSVINIYCTADRFQCFYAILCLMLVFMIADHEE